jgi:hypothetical protein
VTSRRGIRRCFDCRCRFYSLAVAIRCPIIPHRDGTPYTIVIPGRASREPGMTAMHRQVNAAAI